MVLRIDGKPPRSSPGTTDGLAGVAALLLSSVLNDALSNPPFLHHSSPPSRGQSLYCNLSLSLKLALDEEFGASHPSIFIRGYLLFFSPLLNSLGVHQHRLLLGPEPSGEITNTWPPSLSSRPHLFTCRHPGKGMQGPQPCCSHQPMCFELRSPREQSP